MFFTKKNQTTRSIDQPTNYDWWLIGAVILQCILGLAFLASAMANRNSFLADFLKQLVVGGWVGGLLAITLANLDYHWLLKMRSWIIGFVLTSLLYIAIPLLIADTFGLNRLQVINSLDFLQISPYMANNAVRWIYISGITNFQPSELAKLGLLIYVVSYIVDNKDKPFTWDNYKKPIYAVILVTSSILIQPDLGSVVIISCILLSVLWVAKVPIKYLLGGLLIFVLIASLTIFGSRSQWREDRIFVWLSKSICQNYSPGSWNYDLCTNLAVSQRVTRDQSLQIQQIRQAIASGSLFGVGYSRSDLKNYIPEVSTDGIIGVIGAEGGFVTLFLVIFLYLLIFLRGMKIATEAKDEAGKMLATGISIWIILQAFWNIAGMLGLFPLKGIPLPFISEGGSAMVVNLLSIGILLNISTQKDPDYLKLRKTSLTNQVKRAMTKKPLTKMCD